MFETIVAVFVTIVSCLLLALWFRSACLLIIVAKPPRDYVRGMAIANQLAFHEIAEALHYGGARDLENLRNALDRDFLILSELLKRTASGREALIDTGILRIDYWTMGVWCRACWRVSPRAARGALQEMAFIVAHFASTLGERLKDGVSQEYAAFLGGTGTLTE